MSGRSSGSCALGDIWRDWSKDTEQQLGWGRRNQRRLGFWIKRIVAELLNVIFFKRCPQSHSYLYAPLSPYHRDWIPPRAGPVTDIIWDAAWGWTFGMLHEDGWCFLILHSLNIFTSSNKDMASVVRTATSQSQQKYQRTPHRNPDIIRPLTHLESGSPPNSLLRCHLSKSLWADDHLEVLRSITKPLWPTASSSVRWRQVVS